MREFLTRHPINIWFLFVLSIVFLFTIAYIPPEYLKLVILFAMWGGIFWYAGFKYSTRDSFNDWLEQQMTRKDVVGKFARMAYPTERIEPPMIANGGFIGDPILGYHGVNWVPTYNKDLWRDVFIDAGLPADLFDQAFDEYLDYRNRCGHAWKR